MSDELTRAIAEALHADRCADDDCRGGDLGDYDREAEVVLDALAPLIEARVREARADALTDVADVLDASTAKFDRSVGGPTEPTRFVRDIARNLRNDAEEVRRA